MPAKNIIMISNLAWETTAERIREVCSKYGKVVGLRLFKDDVDRGTVPCPFAIVGFSTAAEADAAAAGLDGTNLDGSTVKTQRPRSDLEGDLNEWTESGKAAEVVGTILASFDQAY